MKKANDRQRARQKALTAKHTGNAARARQAEQRAITSRAALSDVMALARRAYVLDFEGVHGPSHWLRVLRNGRELARRTVGAEHGAVLASRQAWRRAMAQCGMA